MDMHHSISDGVSTGIFLQEFSALYRGRELPPLKLQYKDFAHWQQRLFLSEEIEKQETYWLNRFSDEVPVLNLPADHVRPPVQQFEGGRYRFELEKGQTGQLKQLGLDAGATLYMVLTAIFNIFLSKLSGQEDIVVGTPTAGRRRNDLQNIMGMFVNTLALRNYPTGEKSFNQLLQEVKENTLSAFQNQDYQYEDLVDKVVKTRDMSRNPLFDAAFALVNEDMNRELREMELPGLTVTPHQFPETISKFDLTLFAEEGRHGITFNFEYGTSLFKKESIERFARYFKRLTAGVLENPAQPSAGIDILPEEEKHRVLTVFNDTAADYPRDKTIHQLFEEQAYLTPDRTVLTAQADHRSYRTHLTYRQLNESSNRPAHLLREKGVVPDTIVAMKMERSIDMIVVILAILKAGGAYLPIDPAYPQERMDYMLKDSGADILLTKSPLERGERAGCVPRKLAPCPATSLCYVIYTSGTTGKPKGTLTAHYNVTRVVRDTNYIDITAGDRVLQLSNYAFDGSVFDIYGALLNGAALVMVTGKGLSAARVGEVIKREQVTVFFVTTALFNALTDLDTRCLDNIRKVLFGGERVSVEHTAKALEYLGTDKIIHVYGPTETTVYATYHFVRRIDGKLGTVPIGKPLANTTAYILDRAGSPVPIGVAGEIYIGGPGVARGYLNHPELTAEKFSGGSRGAVFQKSPPGVFYRTGDLGRWLPDGDIQFLGRIDHQVKLRGFRVELGEIESRLLNHEQIKEAVVIDLLDPTGDKYLCAYIVPVPGETVAGDIDTGGLKNYLSQFLPGYMIPPYFIQLEQLPLTPNGKLNRKALPVPGTCEDREGYTAPAGELEKKLAALWAGVLGLEENTISADDNFFEKGGHSLKAGRLISRIHKTFDVKFSMAQVFDTPRLRDMAASIKAAATDRYIPIPGIEEKEFYPLSFNQERLWFIHQRNPQSPAFNMPDSLRLPGPAGETAVNAVKKTLAKIARRHESFRTGFKMIDDEPVQFIRPAVEIPVPVIDISSLPETEKEERNRQIFLEMSGNIFDLIAPPLLRALLVKHAPGGYDLLYNIHHIVSDGWSLELFKKEFFHFYERYTAEAEGNTAEIQPQIPQSVNRYKDFALWHRRRVEAEPVDGPSARFWEEQLAGGVPDLQLPRNLGSDNADVKGAGYRCLVAGDIKDKLNKLAADNHTSLFTVMFAVYILVLRRYSNQQEIVSSIINAGRNHDALSGIMGFFVNSLLFKIRVEDNEGFADFLRRVHGGVLESFKHQDYPPDLVVHRLNMRYPDIPVSFNMTNLGEDASQQEVEVFRAYHIPDSHDAKFDIEPYISEYKNGIDIWWSYKKSIFSPDTLEYFVTDYIKLLEYFCEHPQQSYRDFRATGKKRKFSRGQS
ncbi:MAG: amino acid adenylation domain-containing protein, partial [bacterium]|nr:amino acid adenylation domain-containing protein [bacterium]